LQGAQILGGLASLQGGTERQVRKAQEIGALLGARRYSKDFELEADALGAVITLKAGFDAVRGAEFFNRLPDPGDQFLGTHPPNAERLATVRRTAAAL
jgi:predicted Zn-dependent protease